MKVPVPPLQIPPPAPETDPFKVMVEAFAQTAPFAPALTIGAGVKVITRLSVAGLQVPLPVVLKVNVRMPPASSAAVGV